MTDWLLPFLCGLGAAVISAWGVGGGTLLLLVMTLFLGVDQRTAQGINLLFFLPMQLGGREGGFALAVGGLSLSGAYGVYAALITRVREMVWIVIGLALMKVGNFKQSKEKYSA